MKSGSFSVFIISSGVLSTKPKLRTTFVFEHWGCVKFVPGQTDVQVPIKVDVELAASGVRHEQIGEIPLKVSIQGSSAVFQTTTYCGGKR